jgi:hypothetical protein
MISSAVVVIGALVLAVFTRTVESNDSLGRVGFVLLIAATLAVVWLLELRSQRPVIPTAEIFVPSGFIVGLFATAAVMWLLYVHLVLDAFSRGKFGYLEWLTQVTNLVAVKGIWNVWTPYPTGTQEVIVGLRLAASGLASIGESDVWTGYTLFRLGFVLVFLVVPSILSVWLVAKTARALGRSTQTIATITLALSFGVVYFGAASTYVTDPLPAALSVAALLAVLRKRFVIAGLAIGFGAALKLFPILLVPAVIPLMPRNAVFRMVTAAVAVLAVLLLPGAFANPDIFMSPFNWQSSRPPWETVYAFANWVGGVPHDYPQAYFRDASVDSAYGWVFTGITPLVSVLQTPVPPGPLRWENLVSLVGTLLVVLTCAAAGSGAPRAMARWCLFCLAGFLFFGIGWSPQYELFLIPFILLAFDNPFVGAAAAVLLQGVTFLDYPLLLPWGAFYGGSAVWLDWGAIVARYVVLGWLCLHVARSEASWAALRSRIQRLAGKAPAVAALACVPFIVAAAPAGQVSDGCGRTRSVAASGGSLPETDWSVPGGWFFTQAGESLAQGYAIMDDDRAQMWTEFNRLGGWRALGFPASRRFVWHGALSQATQRAVLQWSPVTGQVDFANVLDLLHDEGRDADLAWIQIPPPLDVDEAGLAYEAIAARRLGWLDSRPAIKAKYCNAPGGADPVQLWGLPTSQPVNVGGRGSEVYVLRTQRAAFQEWVGGADWAEPGEVTVVLAGDLAKQFQLLPPDAVIPESAPPSASTGSRTPLLNQLAVQQLGIADHLLE